MRVIALTVALLFGSFGGTAAAGSITLDQELNTVRSVAGSVVELPGASPSPLPELPVVSPKASEVGSVGKESAREPAPQPPVPISVEPPETSDAVASVPSPGSLRATPGAAAPASAGAHTKDAVAPDPVQNGARPSRRARVGAGAGSGDSAPGSIRAAMPAPLEEWLAHLWPAVALGPVGSALTAQAAELAPSLLLAGLSAFVQPSLPTNIAPTGGGPTATPTAQIASPDSHSFFSPDSGGMSFIVTLITVLAALFGLVALARLTYGEDFFSTRWLR
jgi:hypothetical protein